MKDLVSNSYEYSPGGGMLNIHFDLLNFYDYKINQNSIPKPIRYLELLSKCVYIFSKINVNRYSLALLSLLRDFSA